AGPDAESGQESRLSAVLSRWQHGGFAVGPRRMMAQLLHDRFASPSCMCGSPPEAHASYCCLRLFLFGLRRVHRSKETSSYRFVTPCWITPRVKLVCYWIIGTMMKTLVWRW